MRLLHGVDLPIAVVAVDEDLDRQIVLAQEGKLLYVVLQAAVPLAEDRALFSRGDARADGARQPCPHAPEPDGADVLLPIVQLVDVIAIGKCRGGRNIHVIRACILIDVLRDHVAVRQPVRVGNNLGERGVLLPHLVSIGDPSLPIGHLARAAKIRKCRNKSPRIHNNGFLHRHAELFDFRCVDVNHNLTCMRSEVLVVVRGKVVPQSTPDHEQEVGVLKDVICITRCNHARTSIKIAVTATMEEPPCAARGHRWNLQFVHHLYERLACAREHNACSGEDHGTLCCGKHRRDFFQVLRIHCSSLFLRLVPAQGAWVNLRRLHVERDVNPDRTRSIMERSIYSTLQNVTNICRIHHCDGIFCHRFNNRNDANFLCPCLTHTRKCGDRVAPHLSRDNEQRRRVDIRRHERGHDIRRPRSRCRKDDTELVRILRVAVGGKTRRLLVQIVVFVDAVFLGKRVEQMHNAAARE